MKLLKVDLFCEFYYNVLAGVTYLSMEFLNQIQPSLHCGENFFDLLQVALLGFVVFLLEILFTEKSWLLKR